eukprot:TRINITY_DN37516_c1_g2_i1.p1 TRINITY_DN37516_c1_g2~~TRINITY_DN37516_c1_g2_i1.p1  ORF type:complete len:592 (+),score=101.74 TRINITY_DN37516_c1_g2_i1:94-1869(+)
MLCVQPPDFDTQYYLATHVRSCPCSFWQGLHEKFRDKQDDDGGGLVLDNWNWAPPDETSTVQDMHMGSVPGVTLVMPDIPEDDSEEGELFEHLRNRWKQDTPSFNSDRSYKTVGGKQWHSSYNHNLSRWELQQLRTLLGEGMENEFVTHSQTPQGIFCAHDLVRIWEAAVTKRYGWVSAADQSLMAKTARLFMFAHKIQPHENIVYSLFATFVFGKSCSMEAPAQELWNSKCFRSEASCRGHHLRRLLMDVVSRRPDRQQWINAAFSNLCGNPRASLVSLEDMRACVRGLARGAGILESGGDLSIEAIDMILEEAQVDDDDHLDVFDAIAHVLWRRRSPVEVLLYDISSGVSKYLSAPLLGFHFEAIYHSGLLVFGKEYWYGGRVFRSYPAKEARSVGTLLERSDIFHLQPSEYAPGLRSMHLGYTLSNAVELHHYINTVLCKTFSPDKYDAFGCNCNSFADACIRFLTGGQIPEEIMTMPDKVMSSNAVQIMRPFLNRRLGDPATLVPRLPSETPLPQVDIRRPTTGEKKRDFGLMDLTADGMLAHCGAACETFWGRCEPQACGLGAQPHRTEVDVEVPADVVRMQLSRA